MSACLPDATGAVQFSRDELTLLLEMLIRATVAGHDAAPSAMAKVRSALEVNRGL